MPQRRSMTITRNELRAFAAQNPEFDLLSFDFHDAAAVAGLRMGDADAASLLPRLRARQRVLRLTDSLADSEQAARKLLTAGLHSAHHVGAMSRARFLREHGGLFSDLSAAGAVHDKAVAIKAKTQHVWANVADLVASRHYRGTRFYNAQDNLTDYFQQIPSYQELFGGLDYLACPHCRSIFSPSAYFVDLMRITDEYVTYPNTHKESGNIPDGMKLEDRRPDLFTLPLTCENTDTLVPYIQLVNDVLAAKLKRELDQDVFPALAVAPYPFNLPFNAPLAQVRGYLEALKITLAQVYAVMSDPKAAADVAGVAREQVGLSVEQYRMLITTSTTPAQVAAQWGYHDLGGVLPPFTPGTGLITVAKGRTSVEGSETSFDSELTVGDQIWCGAQIRTVAAIAGATSLTVDRAWEVSISQASYQIARWRPGTGTITIHDDSTRVTGSADARFDQLSIGDQVQCLGEIRTVTQVRSATELLVDSRWSRSASGVSYTVNPVGQLARLTTFLDRTGLARRELDELLRQGTSAAEFDRGVTQGFFINATGEGLPPLQLVIDQGDPGNSFERIVGLSVSRLDRLSRFIRLRSALGWTAADTDWLLKSIKAGVEIDAAAIEAMAFTISTAGSSSLPVDVVASFWHDMKTVGRGNEASPQDLFDRVYNPKTLLRGQDPYTSPEPIPFDPARPLDWDIDERTAGTTSATIRSRLVGALGISDGDLTVAGHFVRSLMGAAQSTLRLDLPALSWLYRLVRLASVSKLSIDGFFRLLWQLFYPDHKDPLRPPADSVPCDLAATAKIVAAARWLATSPLSIYQLEYVITGQETAFFKAGFATSDVRGLIATLAAGAAGARLSPASFVAGNIGADKAKEVFDKLVELGAITEIGIVADRPVTYQEKASLFPVGTESFVTDDIDSAQSAQAFTQLASHVPAYIVAAKSAKTGTLSQAFTEATSLDFLFPEDPARTVKQGQVREVLLAVRSDIDSVATVLAQAEAAQEDQAEQGVADFLGLDRGQLSALASISLEHGLPAYRVDLLTPLKTGSPVPTDLDKALTDLARGALWVGSLGFSPAEVDAVATDPRPFGIADVTSLTFADLRTLTEFRGLVTSLNDANGVLLKYFAEPPAKGIPLLAELTGWGAEQITKLIDVFWPGADRDDASRTVHAVRRLREAFDLVAATGADAFFLASLLGLINRPVGVVGGNPDAAAWAEYERVAGQVLDTLSGRYGDGFDEVYAQVGGQIEMAKRDAMVGLLIRLLQPDFPILNTPADLYQFLLVDVEMSDCAITSKIAQAISSVQLYLQRCRMSLEAGVTELDVDQDWWSWLSTYRIWEANRKIFLYPENYLRPQLRSNQSPQFKSLVETLLQADLSEDSVRESYLKYFDELEGLANLVPVSSHNADVSKATRDESSRLYVVARPRTDPYTYYWRAHDEAESWTPWFKVDLSITSPEISAVYAFERLFLFWTELDTGKTSTIEEAAARARYLRSAALRYSFLTTSQQWVQPQVLAGTVPTDVEPDTYDLLKKPQVKHALTPSGLYWAQPYAFRVARGLAGTGRILITKDLHNASGGGTTLFTREVRKGDLISCGGQTREVGIVVDNNNLAVTEPWSRSARNAEFKVIPGNADDNAFPPFEGSGRIRFTATLRLVDGTGTAFGKEINVGDRILAAGEVRTVALVVGPGSLSVDEPWTLTRSDEKYIVIPGDTGAERLVVMLGGTLSTTTGIDPVAPVEPVNTGRDPFLQQRDAFDFGVFYSARLAKLAATAVTGQVTLNFSAVLDADLQMRPSRVLMANYRYSADDNPRPYQYRLDRGERLFQVAENDNAIADNYWGNNAPGTPPPPKPAGLARNLLYNISATSSLRNVGNQIGWAVFDNGDEAFLIRSTEAGLDQLSGIAISHQMPDEELGEALLLSASSFTATPAPFNDLSFKFIRLTTSLLPRLRQRLLVGGVDRLLALDSQALSELPFSRFYTTPDAGPPPGVIPPGERLDFNGSYGLYFREMFLFCPWLVADRLQGEQRFDDAKKWYEHIFNPTAPASITDQHPHDRYWRYLPFRNFTIDSLIDDLTNAKQIAAYNNHPFDPDAIARLRPAAYPKAVVLGYISNLLNWADYLFGLDTSESVNEATQIYVLAADLLGRRPVEVGVCPVPRSQNFADIKARYGQDIPQFLIDLENGLPAIMNSADAPRAVPVNDIRAYFCVPENSDLIGYWDRIDDRLFKIRHCMNLQGVVRQLAVFEPPIDPNQLVRARATARGGRTATALVPGPLPSYRFAMTIEQAKSFALQLMRFGTELLAALEKQDAEHLALLRNTQEAALLDLTVQIKQSAVRSAIATGTALAAAKSAAKKRYDHYQRLIDEELSDEELANLSDLETALVFNVLSSVARTASSIAYTIPQVGSPFAITYGGVQVGSALAAGATVFEIGSIIAQYNAQKSLTMAGYQRRNQDWELQLLIADFDEQAAVGQIAANEAQLAAAQSDLKLTLTSIAQNREVQDFLIRKFTSEQLYQWMAGRLYEVYFQSWLLALDLARAAERAFGYELDSDRRFLDFVYWDSSKKGLVAGESLTLALGQMEKEYTEQYARRLEIEKTISLAQINPRALLDLKATGQCVFHLSERLFDFDFPGQYCRKIKTMAVTIPAVIGPYQTVHATLTQLTNATVLAPDIEAIKYLLGSVTKVPPASVLRSNIWVSQQIALSRGLNDAGLFALDFNDPRYLPFEGTGAVSTWQLRMPPQTNRFDFGTISDVLIQVSYTAKDGGAGLRRQVTAQPELKDYVGSPLLSLAQLYSQDWYAFMTDHSDEEAQTLRFRVMGDIVPPHLDSPKLTGFFFQLITDEASPAAGAAAGAAAEATPYVTFAVTGSQDVKFAPGVKGGYAHSFTDPIDMSAVFDGDRTITFALRDTPAKLKAADGFLNRDVLRNIALVLYFKAAVNWPSNG